MTDMIIIAIVILILTICICYIVREKKHGVKCIGCPSGGACSKKRQSSEACSCNSQEV